MNFTKIKIKTKQKKETKPFTKNYKNQDMELNFVEDSETLSYSIKVNKAVFLETISLECQLSELPVFLKEGFQSWSFSAALDKKDKQKRSFADFVHRNQENVLNKPTGKGGIHVSEQFCFIGKSSDSTGTFLGQRAPFNQYLSYRYNAKKGLLEIIWDFYKQFNQGESCQADGLVIKNGVFEELERAYFDSIKTDMKLDFNNNKRTGWCSWYYYFTQITPEKILANLDAAKEHQLKIDFFQIDDGYQSTVGDWLRLKPDFEGQMKNIAGKISDSGYTPGLWVAPFIISKASQHFNKKGWVLKDKKGKPSVAGLNPAWGGLYYALDLTHPEVKTYISQVFKTMKEDWGFDYFKLDFIYAASLPGERYDKSLTRAEVLKSGMQLIRDAVGKKSSILGCGMPISSAIGTVDAMRVSCDVAPHWYQNKMDKFFKSDSMIETRGALRNSLVRSLMHNRFWINDPDCLMIRTEDTDLTTNERRTLSHLILAYGGMLVFSDDMSAYSDQQRSGLNDTLDLFNKMKDGEISCLDILDSRWPGILYNDKGFLVVSNFQDTKEQKSIPSSFFKKKGIKQLIDFESGEVLDIKLEKGDPDFVLELDVHDSRLFKTK